MDEFTIDIENALEIALAVTITLVIGKALRRKIKKSSTTRAKTAK